MAEALVRYLDANGHPVYASTTEPLPVDIGSATVNINGDVTVSSEVEVKNDTGNPVPASVASLPLPTGAASEAKQDTLITAVDGVEGLLTTIDADTGAIDGKLPALSGGKIPVVGPLTDAELRATALAVSDGGGSITVDGPLTDAQLRAAAVKTLAGLEVPAHDYIDLSYTGANLTGVVYKDGGSGGSTVATLTLAYDGSNNLISVTKS